MTFYWRYPQFTLIAVELPQFVHILFQYIHDHFNSNNIEGELDKKNYIIAQNYTSVCSRK